MTDNEIFSKVIDKMVLSDDMTILQFGVASGNTLLAILENLDNRNSTPTQIIGFDSFIGLCEEEKGVPKQSDWVEGAFNLIWEIKNNRYLKKDVKDTREGIKLIEDRFSQYGEYIDFVEGFYSDTLNKKTIKKYNIQPSSLIDIDCDLYISCKQSLDFLFTNDLLLENCIVRYDDWLMKDIEQYHGGESKAHIEAVEKYGAIFERLDSESHDAVFRYKGRK